MSSSVADISPSTVLEQLRSLAVDPATGSHVSEVARQRADAIQRAVGYLEDHHHSIGFLGQIGIGKSSMIGVTAQLLVGAEPTDRKHLKDSSILAVGSGGTTVCEVRIRRPGQGNPPLGIVIEPMSVEEMRREISDFARDEWRRRKETLQLDENDREPTPREIQRAIRNMTGLPAKQETVIEGGVKRRRLIDPFDDLVAQHDSAGSFANYLLDRAALLNRTEREWWWNNEEHGYSGLKQRFDEINHGRQPTAMLPRRITVFASNPLSEFNGGIEVEVVDTRGFDGQIAGRADIQELLKDPRAILVICAPFRDAPGDSVKLLLEEILADGELRTAAPRTQLVLMDHGDAEGVNGADGDREFGQDLKIGECQRSLESKALGEFAFPGQIIAFDTLHDRPERLRDTLEGRLNAVRARTAEALRIQVQDALSFLDNLENAKIEGARATVDKRLLEAIEANFPEGFPMRDPLEGLYSAIRQGRYVSQVFASCRRGGRYSSFDSFAVVRAGAAKAATEWLGPMDAGVRGMFKTLAHSSDFADVQDHVRLRLAQYKEGHVAFIREYADAVKSDVERLLSQAAVWNRCTDEWGRGSGFKERVVTHLSSWSSQQGKLVAHAEVDKRVLLQPVFPVE